MRHTDRGSDTKVKIVEHHLFRKAASRHWKGHTLLCMSRCPKQHACCRLYRLQTCAKQFDSRSGVIRFCQGRCQFITWSLYWRALLGLEACVVVLSVLKTVYVTTATAAIPRPTHTQLSVKKDDSFTEDCLFLVVESDDALTTSVLTSPAWADCLQRPASDSDCVSGNGDPKLLLRDGWG